MVLPERASEIDFQKKSLQRLFCPNQNRYGVDSVEAQERLKQSEPPRYLFEVPNLTSLLGAGSSAASACWAAGHWGAVFPLAMPLRRPCVPPSIPSPEARAPWSPTQAPCSLLFSAVARADWSLERRTPRPLARSHPESMPKPTQPMCAASTRAPR